MIKRFRPDACRRWCLCVAAVAALLLGGRHGARAQEVEPREFVALPNGTNLELGYYIHATNQGFYTTSGRKVSGSNLEVNFGIERFVHYTYIGGHPAGFQLFQLFGAESDAKLGGQHYQSTFGAANTALSAFYWPYADFQNNRYLVLTAFLYPPVGSYDKNQLLNVAPALSGSEGWTGDLQAGWDQAIGPHFSYDVAADVRFFGDTTGPIQPGVPLSVQQHRATDFRAQLWLNWAWNRAFSTSIGYEGFFGGNAYFDNPLLLGGRGHTNVGASNEQRLRAAAAMFFSPQLGVILEGNHDVDRRGGYSQAWGLTLRALYVF